MQSESYVVIVFVFIGMILFGHFIIPPLRCLLGIHYLDKYPFRNRGRFCSKTYAHYFCHRCKEEIIR